MSGDSIRKISSASCVKGSSGRNNCTSLQVIAAVLIAVLVGPGIACAQNRSPDTMPQPANLGLLKEQLRAYYKCCYAQDIEKVASDAKAYVEQRAPAATKPALVLDIDETSLSNWRMIIQNDFGYIAGGACDLTPNTPCGARASHESPHFSATLKSPTLGFPSWRMEESSGGGLCVRRRNGLI